MKRKKRVNHSYWFIVSVVFFLGCVVCSCYSLFNDTGLLGFTGRVTSPGQVTLTQSGSAGVTLVSGSIALGSGYVNGSGSCGSLPVANLDTNNSARQNNASLAYSPYCWINTTSFLGGDFRSGFVIQNNGSVNVNISAIADKTSEEWFCGVANGCLATDSAALDFLSYNNGTSCYAGLTSGYENLINNVSKFTVGLCDNLQYADAGNQILVYANVSVPRDTTSGSKTLTITFSAIAV